MPSKGAGQNQRNELPYVLPAKLNNPSTIGVPALFGYDSQIWTLRTTWFGPLQSLACANACLDGWDVIVRYSANVSLCWSKDFTSFTWKAQSTLQRNKTSSLPCHPRIWILTPPSPETNEAEGITHGLHQQQRELLCLSHTRSLHWGDFRGG